MGTYVVDIDGTLCESFPGCDYSKCEPIQDVIDATNKAYEAGHEIILFTARGMRSYNGNVEEIELHVKPVLEDWLNRHTVKYHRLIIGKPWGPDVWYVDDKALQPFEFISKVNQ